MRKDGHHGIISQSYSSVAFGLRVCPLLRSFWHVILHKIDGRRSLWFSVSGLGFAAHASKICWSLAVEASCRFPGAFK